MAGRTPHEAVQNFLQPLSLALSCVTRDVLNNSPGRGRRWDPNGGPYKAVLADGGPVKLAGGSGLTLSVIHHFRIVESEGDRGPWKVSSAAYFYTLEDEAGREVVAYHWHPAQRSRVTAPHMHLGAGAGALRDEFHRAHLPTGRVSLEDVLRLAISEFAVKPLRPDWETILDDALRAFKAWRSWSGSRGPSEGSRCSPWGNERVLRNRARSAAVSAISAAAATASPAVKVHGA